MEEKVLGVSDHLIRDREVEEKVLGVSDHLIETERWRRRYWGLGII